MTNREYVQPNTDRNAADYAVRNVILVGKADRQTWTSLPLRGEVAAVAPTTERPRDVCGRTRTKVTEPGYRRGVAPANKGQTYPPEPLTPDEVLALMDRCPERAPFGVRDRALIALLWRSGLRISEALALRPQDLNRQAHTVTVRCGKGGKYRVSGMDPFGWEELDKWLAVRGRYPAGPVFCIVEGRTKGVRAMGAPYFRKALKQLAVQAGIPKRVHPHGFRHSHACDLAGEGVHIHLVSRQLGHSNLGTTATYLAGIAPVEVVNAVAARPAPGTTTEGTPS